MEKKRLRLTFHGRIIDQLGIQMYQSPVAAIAEMVANAWDADATEVHIHVPETMNEKAYIEIRDNGLGMTFQECQHRYLNVGYDRREGNPEAVTRKGRPVLGRKGIGKFAGFGIADRMVVSTISTDTGERTRFIIVASDIRSAEGKAPFEIEADYEPPSEERKKEHGTIIRLEKLRLRRGLSPERFALSMSRRFLLHQRVEDFTILVNGRPLPSGEDLEKIEYSFPRDYSEPPPGTHITDDGWGIEEIQWTEPDGKAIRGEVRWKIVFYRDTIQEEDLRGIAVFAKGKLAQAPFFFQITGGISGQHALEYMSGRVEADFLDSLPEDIITTERQRINWNFPASDVLLEWGREKVKTLAALWKELRAEAKIKAIDEKTGLFNARLSRLQPHERKTLEQALRKLAGIEALSLQHFEELGRAMITAWEKGRLRDLIDRLAQTDEMNESELVGILMETNVLTSLNLGEAVLSKIQLVQGLRHRVENHELENAVRDYIADNPWLLSPEWETFAKETSIRRLLEDWEKKRELPPRLTEEIDQNTQRRRIDLILRNGDRLAIIEFMRPGLQLDRDHVERFEEYIDAVTALIREGDAGVHRVEGLLVADHITDVPKDLRQKLERLRNTGLIIVTDWPSLLHRAESQWKEFLEILSGRVNDPRLQELTP